jgi:MFS family permease
MTDPTLQPPASHEHVRFNAIVNILDGAFFGSALGFASYTTIIPLFVSQLTESAILIGLASSIHTLGWQFPQLLTASRVRRQSRFKPMVLAMTIHERLPFLGLALLAWFLPGLSRSAALALTFALLIWQGFGGGFMANVWQSMIGKIIPRSWRGGFFGVQMAAVNLLSSVSAVIAGQILERYPSPLDFTLCFGLACVGMALSFGFISLTREGEHTPPPSTGEKTTLGSDILRILRTDTVFQRFVAVRMIFQLGMVAFSFYAVYAVDELGLSVSLVGWLTGTLIFAMVIANPLLGMLGDRKSHFLVLFLGTLAALASTALAGWLTSVPAWFTIFALAGVASVVAWTTTMVLSLGFGNASEQATYIGLSNSLLAPVTLVAPFLAGWLIEASGFTAMFRAAALIYLLAAGLSVSVLRGSPIPKAEGPR